MNKQVNKQRCIGAALPSLIAALSQAITVTVTDHPFSSALAGAIHTNIAKNIPAVLRERISIHAHQWGDLPEPEQKNLSSPDASSSKMLSAAAAVGLMPDARKFAAENKGHFTRVICADCLWMKDQHENLVRSLLWFLAPPDVDQRESTSSFAAAQDAGAENQGGRGGRGVAWVVAGFHTGREIVASFFDTAEKMGMVVKAIWERDLNARNEEGEVIRDWMPVREDEGPENRARWCVVAFLQKRKIHLEAPGRVEER
jgi:hypothetical protein